MNISICLRPLEIESETSPAGGTAPEPESGTNPQSETVPETDAGTKPESETAAQKETTTENVTNPAEERQTEPENNNDGESAPSDTAEQPHTEITQETHAVTIPQYEAENVVDVQTLENKQNPEESDIEFDIIKDITWTSMPEYDGSKEGT